MTANDFFDDWNTSYFMDGQDAPRPGHAYAPEELWWPLSASINEWDDEFHLLMMRDRVRMKAYRSAIDAAVKARAAQPLQDRNDYLRVLDIGSGTGVLSLMVADAWAALPQQTRNQWLGLRIYGVERDQETALHSMRILATPRGGPHGVQARRVLWDFQSEASSPSGHHSTLIVACHSDDLHAKLLDIAETLEDFDTSLAKALANGTSKVFDMIVTETIGGLGDDEDVVRIVDRAAANFARGGCLFVPEHITSELTPVICPPRHPGPFRDIANLLSDRNRYKAISRRYDTGSIADPYSVIWDCLVPDQLSQDTWKQRVREWKLGREPAGQQESSTRYTYYAPVSHDVQVHGTLVGFKGSFHATLTPGVTLTNTAAAPHTGATRLSSDCWKHRFIPIENPIYVMPGDRLELRWRRRGTLEHSVDYTWAGHVSRQKRVVGAFSQSASLRKPAPTRELVKAARSFRKQAFDYTMAMSLALLVGLFADMALGGFSAWGERFLLTVVLLGWSIWLFRVAVSAFVLASDGDYLDSVNLRSASTYTPLRFWATCVRSAGTIAQFGLLTVGLVVLGVLSYVLGQTPVGRHAAAVPMTLGWLCLLNSVCMLVWDIVPWRACKSHLNAMIVNHRIDEVADTVSRIVSVGSTPRVRCLLALGLVSRRYATLSTAFAHWVLADIGLALVGIVSLFLTCSGTGIGIGDTGLALIMATPLVLLSAIDWYWNWTFYTEVPRQL